MLSQVMKYQKIELPSGSSYEIAKDDDCIVVKSKKNQVWLSVEMIQWLNNMITPKSDACVVILEMNEVSDLVGKLLTIADASFTDKEQRNGVKSLIKQIVWRWGKEYHLAVTEEQLEEMIETSEEISNDVIQNDPRNIVEHYE